jgi:predicted amidohydrolase YtcJ
MITLAIERGEQVAVHATGDRSIEEFLRVLEAHPPPAPRRTTSCTPTSRRPRRSSACAPSAPGSPCSR